MAALEIHNVCSSPRKKSQSSKKGTSTSVNSVTPATSLPPLPDADICDLCGSRDSYLEIISFLGDAVGLPQTDARRLYTAAFTGEAGVVAKLLQDGVNVDSVNHKGRSALFIAATNGHLKVCDILLKAGASTSLKDKHGRQALHMACQGHLEIAALLLKAGADCEATDTDNWRPLHHASFYGNADIIKELIMVYAEVNAQTKSGSTALYYTVQEGHLDCARMLLSCGADPNIRRLNRRTALHVAASEGHLEVTRLLLRYCACVDAEDKDGWRPLHLAAVRGNPGLVTLLLFYNSAINARTRSGMTALGYAMRKGDDACVAVLRKYGADPVASCRRGALPEALARTLGYTDVVTLLQDYQTAVNGERVLHDRPALLPLNVSDTDRVLGIFGEDEVPPAFPGHHAGAEEVPDTKETRKSSKGSIIEGYSGENVTEEIIIEPVCYPDLPAEIQRQDEYLSRAGLRRSYIKPDDACFFSAVSRSARSFLHTPRDLTGPRLRRETVRELFRNVGEYKSVMLGPGKSISSADTAVYRDLRDQGAPGQWIGYESVLAVSKILSAAVLVTSGGQGEGVVTDRVCAPSLGSSGRQVHLVWVSVGYYEAVVPELDSGHPTGPAPAHPTFPSPGHQRVHYHRSPAHIPPLGAQGFESDIDLQKAMLTKGKTNTRDHELPSESTVICDLALDDYSDSKATEKENKNPTIDDLDTPHQRHLVTNHKVIAEYVDFDEVVSTLYSHGIMDFGAKQMADDMKVGDVHKSRRLLLALAKMSEAAFRKIVKVLKKAGHRHLAALLLDPALCKEAKHWHLLQTHHSILLTVLDPDTLLSPLFSKGVISNTEKTKIAAGDNVIDRTDRLLSVIRRKSPPLFQTFLTVLRSNAQGHVADMLKISDNDSDVTKL